jgi:alkanesulfonate monooxygenase SsuD/methylene tetrahydromethanopterin reductase-like flavin-dependent oxidoreductase (luciferase family)
MEIAIGLPNMVSGTMGEQLVEFARRGEQHGFSSLGTLDRLVYDSYDPLIALAAAATVTERIRLLTSILIAPIRPNAAMLAKVTASVHALSGGRLTLAMAIGARDDDYEASGLATSGRGTKLEEQIEEMRRIWDGEERGYVGAIGPRVDPPPTIIVGGGAEASYKRAARLGDGWMMGAQTPEQLAKGAEQVKKEWDAAGREGEPRIMALAYYALGPDAERHAEKDLKHYYGWLGEEVAGMIAGAAATDAETVRGYVSGFEQAGCDELVFFPCASDPEQADLLAEAVGK